MLPYIAAASSTSLSRGRYKAPLYLFIAAILCGLATLAKGLAGLGLPVLVFIAYLGFTWNWRRLARAQLGFGIAVALLAVAVIAVPWHHAMLIRHGRPFWDELYGDNHWRRLVLGATAIAAGSSTSCASSATPCCPGWRSRRGRWRRW